MFGFLKYTPASDKKNFDLTFGDFPPAKSKNKIENIKVSPDIEKNIEIINNIFHTDKNGDIIIRKFNWTVCEKSVKGVIVSADGLASGESLNEFILTPVMFRNYEYKNDCPLINFFAESVLPQGQITYENSLVKMTDKVNIGNAIILISGCENGIVADIKSWEHRGVDSPVNEAVVQGPHEGFNEVMRCNTALIRKTINSSDLIMESVSFGSKSQTPGSLAYIDGTINPALLSEIQKRLSSIDADYVLSVFDVEKAIEERKNITLPQIITTERPDKVCRALIEGRAALVMNGSSHVLILPSNITDIIASPEDSYLRKPYSVFIKIIRILAVVLSLLTPGIYLAVTRFHSEAILTDMLITLSSARDGVPFSSLTEVIIMEFAFELIKEAGIRVPGAIGSSLGIVGGLILGQSAVSAGLVSPIIIIIVSICGISSFAIPSYSLSFSFRISRFAYIFLGAFFGMTGIISALCIQITLILSTKSFGVPFCVPFAPKTAKHPFFYAFFDTHSLVKSPKYLKANKGDVNNEE